MFECEQTDKQTDTQIAILLEVIIPSAVKLVVCRCAFDDRLTGKSTRAINMGSYNYLGFAQPTGACADDAERTTREIGLSVCSSRHELGTTIKYRRQSLASRGPKSSGGHIASNTLGKTMEWKKNMENHSV